MTFIYYIILFTTLLSLEVNSSVKNCWTQGLASPIIFFDFISGWPER